MPEGYVDFLGVEQDDSLGEVAKLRFNYYSDEDDRFYKGVEISYPWNSDRLSAHVSAEEFVAVVSKAVSKDYNLQSDLYDYINSGRDESLLPYVQSSCKTACVHAQARAFSNHSEEMGYEVENQTPLIWKTLVDHFHENEEDIRSRIVIEKDAPELEREPSQKIDFIGAGDDGLRFRLNYVKDGRLHPGVPVCVKGISDSESQQGLLYRIDATLSVDDGVLNDQLAYYCENRGSADKSAVVIADNSLKSVQAALYDMAGNYSKERERFHQYDVEAKEASQLVEVDSSLLGKLRVSLNYKTDNDYFRKGITLDMDCPSWCKTDQDVAMFRECIQKRYAEGNYEDIYRQVTNRVGGHDTIAAIRMDARADRDKNVFETYMEDRKKSLETACVSFLSEVRNDYENESLFSDMDRIYGNRKNLVEVVRSDDDSVTLRFNYRHRDAFGREVFAGENGRTELSPVQNGVVYTMSWYGADSLNVETKARFIELLEAQLEQDKELQERICRYSLNRFRNGEGKMGDKDDVRLRMDDDGRSSEMAAWLREFEQDVKFRLPQLRKERMDKEQDDIKVLRMRFYSCAMALEEDRVRTKKRGIFGKFRMIIFHHKEWQEQEQRREELRNEYSVLQKQCELVNSVGGASVRSCEILGELNKVHVSNSVAFEFGKEWSVDVSVKDVLKDMSKDNEAGLKKTGSRSNDSDEIKTEVVFESSGRRSRDVGR